MTVGKDFCFIGFCPGKLESSGSALKCLFSVSDVRNQNFALGSPPLSGTVDTRIVTQKHVRWEMVSSKHFHYELQWNYFGPPRENLWSII
ncbi:hypothetical protein CEXT_180981 [Caerostris extrusa]|uniref:Uncharacterized protein n=1 Tax=Caerostris extrusa TaxID=172846 RepID=A0AAV4X9Z2_CAEEX|nr:hypothetical protein CEXT_180981 [Caerostris extrusa]